MKKDKLKEYYGTQRPSFAGGPGAGSNFYSGRDLGTHSRGSLGTRGADSNFSRRMQALVPNDYYDLLEEEDDEIIDENIVVENSRYSLKKIFKLNEDAPYADPEEDPFLRDAVVEILSDPTELSKFENSLGNKLYEFGSEFVLRDIASFTLGGDELIGFLRIIINIFFQIRRTNNEVERQKEIIEKYFKYIGNNSSDINSNQNRKNKEISVIQEHIVKLQDLQDDLIRDIIDALQGAISLFPDDAVGTTAAIETSLGKLAEKLPKFFESLEIESLSELEMIVKKEPEFEALRYVIALLSGIKFLSNFAMLTTGPVGIIPTVLSLLNINIFNPFKILISGIRSVFVISDLQNKLMVADQTLKSNRAEYFYTPDIEYSEENALPSAASPSSTSEFIRKLFVSKPGDTGLFSESLKNKSLSYLIEERDSVLDEDLEENENEIEEFSGAGAAAIGTLPLGVSTKGPGKSHSSSRGGKAFPYSKKNRENFKKYTKNTFGGKS